MRKSTHIGVSFVVVALLLCGLLFFSRLPFGTRETTSQQPHTSVTTVPTASPIPNQVENGAGPFGLEKPQMNGRKLRQTNATLETARQKAVADKTRSEKKAGLLTAFNGKLLDPNLKSPRTSAEAASLMGQNLADTAKFKQRWGDSAPAAGTPEADEYAREQETLVSESAAFLKFMADEKSRALLAQPDGIAQFQSAALAVALDLRADQVQGIGTALNGYYQQFFAEGLNSAAQPQTGMEGWQQQRSAISQQSYAAVSAFLTPEQATAFQRLYPAAGSWMLNAVVPDIPGLDETH